MKARLDYAENLDKTNNGELVSSYKCDPHLAWQEFMLDRNKYLSRNGSERRGDILAYQIRQSFKPGEIKAEEANAVGYESYVVCGRVSGSRDHARDGLTRHAWVRIGGLNYDPEGQFAGWYRGCYGASGYRIRHTVQRTVKFW